MLFRSQVEGPARCVRGLGARRPPSRRSGPLERDLMYADGQLVSYDNRRLISVQNAQLDKLKVDLVNENDIMPVSKKTWKKAFQKKI